MSDTHAVPTTEAAQLFTAAEIREFDAHDAEAGRVICKLLCTLFVYTLVAMSAVSIWTASVSN